jgi:radical SAM family protein
LSVTPYYRREGMCIFMHLVDILKLRTKPAAGVCIELTRRCPLRCSHCVTDSSADSVQIPAGAYLKFAETFAEEPPEIVIMSGGEPMLRPRLVTAIAARARAAGARSYVLTGAFFVNAAKIPAQIHRAIEEIDHLAISIDAFHECHVPQDSVHKLLAWLRARGISASVQVVTWPGDRHAPLAISKLRDAFDDQLPVLVAPLISAGRTASWLRAAATAADDSPLPCALAAWPVVAADGTITACGSPRAGREDGPSHLRLGHLARDPWPVIRHRCLSAPVLRGVRAFGPRYLGARFEDASTEGYCGTCLRLSDRGETVARIAEAMQQPTGMLAEALALGPDSSGAARAFARRYGVAPYAELVELGYGSSGAAADAR